MAMLNGKDYGDDLKIYICGVEVTGVTSISYNDEAKQLNVQYSMVPKRIHWKGTLDLRPPKPRKRIEPSLIEVVALGKHNNN